MFKVLNSLVLAIALVGLVGCSTKRKKQEEQQMKDSIGSINKKRFDEDGVTCYYFSKWLKPKSKDEKEKAHGFAGIGGLSCVRDDD